MRLSCEVNHVTCAKKIMQNTAASHVASDIMSLLNGKSVYFRSGRLV